MTPRSTPPFRPACGALRRELRRLEPAGPTGRAATDAAPAYRPDRACPPGCNCVEHLLGAESYQRECAAGALFLLEDWARAWPDWARATFGAHGDVLREILRADHRYLLCLRTPCSGDYAAAAAEAGRRSGLPVRWLDVGLDGLADAVSPDPTAGTRP